METWDGTSWQVVASPNVGAGSNDLFGVSCATTTMTVMDGANANFGGTFVQGNNSVGNYAVFTINATGFTLTATPGTPSDGYPRAPVNGMQIVALGQAPPDFT